MISDLAVQISPFVIRFSGAFEPIFNAHSAFVNRRFALLGLVQAEIRNAQSAINNCPLVK